MKGTVTPIPWWAAEPRRLALELEAMERAAPELQWHAEHGIWTGLLPLWPFDRPEPAVLDSFVNKRRFQLAVMPFQAHPAVAPAFLPLDPEPELHERTQAKWHVLGDGSLCLFQRAADWTGEGRCADLIPKAAGWHLEYLLMKRKLIESMTVNGIVVDDCHDHLFSEATGVPA